MRRAGLSVSAELLVYNFTSQLRIGPCRPGQVQACSCQSSPVRAGCYQSGHINGEISERKTPATLTTSNC